MSLAEIWPKAFSEGKGSSGYAVKLHNLEIRLKAHTVRNYLDFATRYTGKKYVIKSQIFSIMFVAVSDNDSSNTDYLMNTPRTWQV